MPYYDPSYPLTNTTTTAWNSASSYSGLGSSTFSVSLPPSPTLVDYEHIRQIIREEIVAYFEDGQDVLAKTVPLEDDEPGMCRGITCEEEEETLS
jgi:hypothetical protein